MEKVQEEKNISQKDSQPERENSNQNIHQENKKIKNLIAALILISGFFVGSLFVDLSHFIKGEGFSEKNLRKTDIFQSDEKVWVAYSEPVVEVKVINDKECKGCDPSEALVWLRRVSPTINAEEISFDSEEGRELIEEFSIKTIPAFIFSKDITKTEFYAQAQTLFIQKGNQFELKMQELGMKPGKYLEIPKINENDAIFGNKESKVKVVIFFDFQCPYCRAFYQAVRNIVKQYGDEVVLAYKHLPLDFHSQAQNAALASKCALEQEKFWEYSDKLFIDQSVWEETEGTLEFKNMAKLLGLNSQEFNKCLDEKRHLTEIELNKSEALSFGITGTPAIFINNNFENGVISEEDLKKLIEEELVK